MDSCCIALKLFQESIRHFVLMSVLHGNTTATRVFNLSLTFCHVLCQRLEEGYVDVSIHDELLVCRNNINSVFPTYEYCV